MMYSLMNKDLKRLMSLLVLPVLLCCGCVGTALGDTPHGMAILYVRELVPQISRFQAKLSLPEQKRNTSWYCTWIMLLPYGDRSTEPFLQVGLMRWPGSGAGPRPFVAYRKNSGVLYSRPLSTGLTNSTHTVQIDVSSSGAISLQVDQHSLLSANAAEFFPGRPNLYFQIGDEVSAYNDTLSGTISGILADDGRKARPRFPDCGYADAGLSLRLDKNEWRPKGVFRSNNGRFFIPSTLERVGACS